MFDSWQKVLGVVGGLLAIFATLFGGYTYLETRFALASELEKTKARLEYKITNDQFISVKDRIYKLEDRYQGKAMPDTVKEEYRQLQDTSKSLAIKLQEMEKKGIQ